MHAPTSFRPWFRVGPAPNAQIRLFCLPHAGAGASMFHAWQAAVPEHVQICPVELPGRETRYHEAPLGNLAQMVHELVPVLGCFLDRPYALFGHSLGALIAYELARELRRRHRPLPVRFFPSACRAPHLAPRRPPIHHLDDESFLDQLRQIGGIPDVTAGNGELMDSVLPALRGDFEMFETYRYIFEPAFAFPITALGGIDDPWISRGDLVAWHSHTIASFHLRLLPGGHFFFRSAPERVIRIVIEGLL